MGVWNTINGIALLMPATLLLAAWGFTRRKSAWARIAWMGLAVLAGLPIGLASIPYLVAFSFGHASAGAGVAYTPLILGWLISLLLWLCASLFALANSRARPKQH